MTNNMLLASKWIFSQPRAVGKARFPFPVFVDHTRKVMTEAGGTGSSGQPHVPCAWLHSPENPETLGTVELSELAFHSS